MAKQSWKLRLEFECDDNDRPKRIIEIAGEHDGSPEIRAINECVAIDMGYIMKMFLVGGVVSV